MSESSAIATPGGAHTHPDRPPAGLETPPALTHPPQSAHPLREARGRMENPRMQRRYLLVLLALSFGLVPLLVHGCSTETAFESVCDWVADPNNCYREFRAGMLADDARAERPRARAARSPARSLPRSTSRTARARHPERRLPDHGDARYLLHRTAAASVTFNPPINLAAYPPPLMSTPVTYTITFLDAFGVTVRHATYTSPHGFSITIARPRPAQAGGGGARAERRRLRVRQRRGSDGAFEATPAFGTYTQTIAPGLDEFNVTCPSGETHLFNLDESGDAVQPSRGARRARAPGTPPSSRARRSRSIPAASTGRAR